MYVQPVDDYGHCAGGNLSHLIGQQVIQGSAAADNVQYFLPYYGAYVFDTNGCIAAE
jgi:hypothetical protein